MPLCEDGHRDEERGGRLGATKRHQRRGSTVVGRCLPGETPRARAAAPRNKTRRARAGMHMHRRGGRRGAFSGRGMPPVCPSSSAVASAPRPRPPRPGSAPETMLGSISCDVNVRIDVSMIEPRVKTPSTGILAKYPFSGLSRSYLTLKFPKNRNFFVFPGQISIFWPVTQSFDLKISKKSKNFRFS